MTSHLRHINVDRFDLPKKIRLTNHGTLRSKDSAGSSTVTAVTVILHYLAATMSHCCICGFKRGNKLFLYDDKKYFSLGLIRIFDRVSVCIECHQKISGGKLIALHSQLPLPARKYDIHRGVYATTTYMAHELVGEYSGNIITDHKEKELSDSLYIINRFYGNPPMHQRSWIDGNCVCKCFASFIFFVFFCFHPFFVVLYIILLLLLLVFTQFFSFFFYFAHFCFCFCFYNRHVHQPPCHWGV